MPNLFSKSQGYDFWLWASGKLYLVLNISFCQFVMNILVKVFII